MVVGPNERSRPDGSDSSGTGASGKGAERRSTIFGCVPIRRVYNSSTETARLEEIYPSSGYALKGRWVTWHSFKPAERCGMTLS